jgi:hypothetical protein
MPDAAKQQNDLIKKRANQYKNTFATPDGKAVLDDLRAAYKERPLFNPDPLKMAANCMAHDLVIRIERFIDVGKGTIKAAPIKIKTEKEETEYDPNDVIFPEE